MVMMILSALVKKFSVLRMQDFFSQKIRKFWKSFFFAEKRKYDCILIVLPIEEISIQTELLTPTVSESLSVRRSKQKKEIQKISKNVNQLGNMEISQKIIFFEKITFF